MDKKRLNILGLSYSQTQSGAYALVLAEEGGKRRIPIIIGGAEAQSIAIQLEGLKPIRPLTHDLFVSMAKRFQIALIEVNVYKLEEGIFYSELVCLQGSSQERISIDARTSDAIALALRFHCPIFTTEDILRKAGIVIDFDEKDGDASVEEYGEEEKESLADYAVEELQAMLQDAIKTENYEHASVLRDEIKRRKKEEEK